MLLQRYLPNAGSVECPSTRARASTVHVNAGGTTVHVNAAGTTPASPQPGSIASSPYDAPSAPPILSRRQLITAAAGSLAVCVCCGTSTHSAAYAAAAPSPFTYSSAGMDWGGSCSTGTQQSPIDLPPSHPPGSTNGATCKAAPLTFSYFSSSATVLNTGVGTMQVNLAPGNVVSVGDLQLQLLQFHFHTPSEHAWGGERSAMEAHLVHRNLRTGGLAVFAVLLDPGGFLPNPCVGAALRYAPHTPRQEVACPDLVNPAQLLPGMRRYLHYRGSLTTPPCTEAVDWFVLERPLRVPSQQVLDFMRYVGADHTYASNARPLQARNGRDLDFDCAAAVPHADA